MVGHVCHRPRRRRLLDISTAVGASAAAVAAAYFDMTREIAVEVHRGRPAEPEEWRDAVVLNNADLWLTVEEFPLVGQDLGAVLEPYRSRSRPEFSRGSG